MPIASSFKDILLFGSLLLVATAATAALAFTLGRLLARRSRTLAVLACGAAFSLALAFTTIILVKAAPVAPPPNDAPAMLLVAGFTLALLTLPATLVTASLMILCGRKVA